MPKYSFIVPIYKVEKYLHKCVDAILSQKITDFECILVDDDSPDNCPVICDEYAKKDNRIKVVHKQNGGLSSARNAGLDIATGQYICFVDSDDYITSDYLEEIDKCIEETNADIVVFNRAIINEENNEKTFFRLSEAEYVIKGNEERFDFYCKKLLQYGVAWEAWSRVYKHSIIQENNLRFYDNKTIFAEDLHFMLIYCMHCEKINVLDRVLYYYLKRATSIMGANKASKINEFVNLSYIFYQYLQELDNTYFQENFQSLFYLIMANRFGKVGLDERLKDLIKVEKKKFLKLQVKRVLKDFTSIEKHSGSSVFREERERYSLYYSYAKSSFSGTLFKFYLKIKRFVIRVLSCFKHRICFPLKEYLIRVPDKFWRKNIYLIGTEDFGNLGDHLIAVSEIKYLKDRYPKHHIIEVPASTFAYRIQDLKKRVKQSDKIFLTGGGNMGDLYPFAENIRIKAIESFPNSEITIFPQTIFFDYLEKNGGESSANYAKATKLTIVAREKYSYELAKKIYKNATVLLTPDIVFYESLQTYEKRGDVVRLCLRSDKEGLLSSADKEKILSCIGENVEFFDMQQPFNISVQDRAAYLDEVLKKYRTAKLIVTDRLHGMIVSAVTGTPCIVLNSKSYKMKGSYEWVKDLGYIKMLDNADEFLTVYNGLKNIQNTIYPVEEFAKIIKNI